ncbi:hypothetical protein [Streptomyces sp. NPDC001851]|uniref:hypothetical protein n=1 Tax=Streptomyces sp. NPDC001851 TaxID=3154529 RepID=UPI003334354F
MIRSHIASVITNRTDTSDQLISPPKRHALARHEPADADVFFDRDEPIERLHLITRHADTLTEGAAAALGRLANRSA